MNFVLTLLVSLLLLAPASALGTPECGTVMTTEQAQVTAGSIVWVGDPPPGVQASEVEEAIEHGVQQWNSVTCSTARLSYEGRLETTEEVDGQIPLLFATPGEVPCFPDGFLGFTVFACDGIQTPTVYLNDQDFTWVADPQPFQDRSNLQVDLRSAITHELGHVLGIPHLEHPLATMVANYLIDGGQSSLAADDKLALCDITGGGNDECSTGEDCDGFGACTVGPDFNVCNEERGSFGDYCSFAFQICDEVCLITDRAQGVGYCSRECSADSRCPADYACVESGETSRCELESVFEDDAGCSSTQTEPTWLLLLMVLALTSIRARLRSSQNPCEDGHAYSR